VDFFGRKVPIKKGRDVEGKNWVVVTSLQVPSIHCWAV